MSGIGRALTALSVSLIALLVAFGGLAVLPLSPASAAPATCGGVIFQDYDADGERVEDYSYISPEYAAVPDAGVSGLTVTVTDSAGGVFTDTTDVDGVWSVTVDDADFPVRVDVTGYPSTWSPGPIGPDSGSINQFIADAADCAGPFDGTGQAGNASVSAPGSFCENRPDFVTSCYLFGNIATHDSEAAIVSLIDGAVDNLSTTSASWQDDPYTTLATLGEVGTVYGIANRPVDGSVYASSFVKRHTQLGPNENPTTIYRVGPTGPEEWFDVDALATNPHSGATDGWLNDDAAFAAVGREGLGDLEISPDGNTLYTVDLGNRQLVAIPINADGSANTSGVVRTDITATALGVDATCDANDVRPFGLGFTEDGDLLVGAVCSAESTVTAAEYPVDHVNGPHAGDKSELDAWVFTYNAGAFSNRIDVPLPTTDRGTQNGQTTGDNAYRGRSDWRPWVTQAPYQADFTGYPAGGVTYPQPLLSDIEADGDDLIISFMDLWGHQAGSNAFLPNYDGVIANAYQIDQPLSSGDTLRAVSDNAGGFTFPTTGADFFYTGDNYQNGHNETTLGSSGQIPGRPYTVTNSFDPINPAGTWQSGGLEWFDNSGLGSLTAGDHVRGYRLYDGNDGQFSDGASSADGTFEKAAGVGDLQATCGIAPVEIGNRVWLDLDGDGVQDPEEMPLAGVTVELLAVDGTFIASTVTDSEGNYVFTMADGVDFNTAYLIDFDVATTTSTLVGGLTPSDLVETVANNATGASADGIDSDVVNNQIAVTTGGPGENDHTLDAGYAPNFDLALTKVYTSDNSADGNATDGIIETGDDVDFTITVTNQGSRNATSFTVTDYIPTGFVLNDTDWTAGAGSTATFTSTTTLLAGNSIDIPITLTADTASPGDFVNWAEISADSGDDVDSTTDAVQGNDNQPAAPGDATDDDVTNAAGPGGADEDDHDPAGVTVGFYDLALTKVYTVDDFGTDAATTSDGIVENGRNVQFTITVTNQGTIDANSFTITDYIPAGFTLNDSNWTTGPGNTATYTSNSTLAPGDSRNIVILLRADSATPGDHVNWAEISADDGIDVDSTTDSTQGNDNQPDAPGDATDDVIDNSTGPGGADEDDHDPAPITVANFDLALTKVFADDDFGDTTDGVVQNGSNATFTITVTNQGTIDATSFTITDYIPAGFILNDGDWATAAGNTATYTSTTTLLAGNSIDIPITLTADTASPGDLVNWAEISADDGTDVDSTTDAVQGNDNQPDAPGDATDDVIDNSTGPGGADEDDHDPAPITVEVYDLALTKVFANDDFGNTTDGVIENGSDATFTITVTNQGTVNATSFEVTDYIPAGFVLNDGNWSTGAGNTATYTSTTTLLAGNSIDIPITLTAVSASAGASVNWAEISADSGDDVDSAPDATQGNDNQPAAPGDPTDDVIDNSTGPGGADEDDHDPAAVNVVAFDLALTKVYTEDDFGDTTDGLVQNGSHVIFTITVTNQGSINATSFEVTDYIPAGFILNDAAWTPGVGNTATYTGGALNAGNSIDIPITLTADSAADGNFVNWAEISADSGNDVDSTTDTVQGNDNQPAAPGDPTDDVTNNAAGPGGADEDDHDPAPISVGSYDLALTKVYASDDYDVTNDGIIEPGADVDFTITVTNQGTVDANSFTITDYIPTGFTLNDGAWTPGAGNTATYTSTTTLLAGDSIDISITLTAGVVGAGDYVNWAEISADDGADVDSTPDGTQGNDNQPDAPGDATDDATDNSTGPGGADEDDHDPAGVTVEVYDLALTKAYTSDDYDVTNDGIIEPGADVIFTITVTNQGTVDADTFTVTDYLPAGFTLNDGNWTAGAGNTATYTHTTTLPAGNSIDIPIMMTAGAVAPGSYVNWAEISADDGNDIDSTTDATQGNDNQPSTAGDPTDDAIDNSTDAAGDPDEDDHDPAAVGVANYDLALTKVYTEDDFGDTTDGLVQNGSNVTFTITVTNQGTIAADTFTITDYIPAGFVLNDGAWTPGAGNTATYTHTTTLPAGNSIDIPITMTADSAADGNLVNWAEISADDGNDIDSTTDATQGNDNQPVAPGDPTDNVTNNATGPGGADEDDHDPAPITVGSYDLALIKVYTSDTYGAPADGIIEPGADVDFTITVTNQGTIDADTYAVTDYIPTGFTLNDGAWTPGPGNTATYTSTTTLTASDSIDIPITLTATTALAGDFVNWAEISDDDGDDVDSTPDQTQGNDNQPASPGDATDDVTNNAAGPGGADEDDHDPAGVTVEVYDLALTKVYTSDTSADGNANDGLLQVGDDVMFTITVTNQGTVDATTFTITDTPPAGFTLNDPAWTANGDGTANYVGGALAAGSSVPVTVNFTVDSSGAGDLINLAEISVDDGNDIDSTPNVDATDDNQPALPGDPTDDVTDNSAGPGGADEDDHDIAGVTVDAYDLALIKQYVSDTSADGNSTDGQIVAGDDVTFSITVINQGTADAANIEVTDTFPAGFSLNDPAWTDNGNGTAQRTITSVPAGDSVVVTITLTADGAAIGTTLNLAEITTDDGTDIDSTPSVDPLDDGTPVDDVVDNTGGDEDDHDPAPITVVPDYDLALVKMLDTSATNLPIVDGQNVTFTITVINQGTTPAQNISIIDYVDLSMWVGFNAADNPAGTTSGDASLPFVWTAAGADGSVTLTGVLDGGESVRIPVTLTIAGGAQLDTLLNTAEISSATPINPDGTPMIGVPDADSTPDTANTDPLVDDVTDNSGGDEDDHDVAGVIAPTYSVGNQVWFDENNDGMINAGEAGIGGVTVMLFTDADGDGVADDIDGDGVITAADAVATTITDSSGLYLFDDLDSGDYVVGLPGSNWDTTGPLFGTLSSDPTTADPDGDVDSDDDGTPTNGFVFSGAVTIGDGEPTGENPDNDVVTADLNENLTVDFGVWRPVYDLALRKQLENGANSATVRIGDTVTFTLTVINQGTTSVTDIQVIDYVPAGLTLADDDWTSTTTGATTSLPGTLAPGASIAVDITFTVNEDAPLAIENNAEISNAAAIDAAGEFIVMPNGIAISDLDSTPDASDSETPIDDVVDNSSGDEDDHDVAVLVRAQTTTTTTTTIAFTGASTTAIALIGSLLLLIGGSFLLLGRRRHDNDATSL